MKKKLIAAILLIGLTVVLATPFCRYGILGLVRGESFYQGRPTCYWRGVVKDWAGLLKSFEIRDGSSIYSIDMPAATPPPPTLFVKARSYFDKLFVEEVQVPPSEVVALPIYVELLGDEDADVRGHAARMIGVMGPPARLALPRLIPLLHDGDSQVRQYSIAAIASIEGQAAVPRLAPFLRDSDPEVRRWTAITLGPMEGGIDLVLPLMKDSEPVVRRRVANLLGEIGQPKKKVISALHDALNDADDQVRVEAEYALKLLTTKKE